MSDPAPPSFERPPEYWIHRAQSFWRMVLFLPFVYAGVAAFVENRWFRDAYPDGFWPVSDHAMLLVIFAFAGAALCSQVVVIAIRHRIRTRLESERESASAIGRLVWRRTLWTAAMADVVSALGFVLFLFRGYWYCLIGFCIASYLIYAQAAPDGRYLDVIRSREDDAP